MSQRPPAPQVITDDGDTVRIPETVFIAMINEIYLNADDYLGRSISYEGFFMTSVYEETNETYNYVVRYGPGCHAFDAFAGFEVTYDGDWPQENDWVEATGILEEYEEDGWKYLRLRLTALTSLETRGAEYVYQ